MGRTRIGAVLAAASLTALGTVGGQHAYAGNESDRAPATEVAATASPDCGGQVPTRPDGSSYRCTFTENFDGRELDRSTWVVQDTARTGFHMGDTCFTDDGTHLRVRGGELTLLVSESSTRFTCKTPTGGFQTRYRGADISTWGNFAQTRGRFEARIRFDRAVTAGVHGGFWMNPQDKIYGGWPNSGEIDVAEWWSLRPEHVHPSLHYLGRDFWDDTGWDCHVGRAWDYHTYAVEWDETVMRFIYDGQVCWTRDWEPSIGVSETAPFDHPFYLSLSQAAGVPNGWSMDPATRYPATLSVDYVRAWS